VDEILVILKYYLVYLGIRDSILRILENGACDTLWKQKLEDVWSTRVDPVDR